VIRDSDMLQKLAWNYYVLVTRALLNPYELVEVDYME